MIFFLTLIFAIFIGCSPVQAHRINIFATQEGGLIRGEVFFSDGKPVRSAEVEVATAGKHLKTHTDSQGRFEVSLSPSPSEEIKIIAYAGMGHRAEITLPASGKSSSPPHTTRFQAKSISWRDVFSGLGYIVGFFGFLAYLRSKNRAAS